MNVTSFLHEYLLPPSDAVRTFEYICGQYRFQVLCCLLCPLLSISVLYVYECLSVAVNLISHAFSTFSMGFLVLTIVRALNATVEVVHISWAST